MNMKKELKEILSPLLEDFPDDQWPAIQEEIIRRGLQPTPKPRICYRRIITIAATCATALVAIIGIALCIHSPKTKPTIDKLNSSEIESSSTSYNNPINDKVFVNKLKIQHDPGYYVVDSEKMYIKEITLDELIAFLGYQIKPIHVPQDIYFDSEFIKKHPPKLEYYNDGTLITYQTYNQFHFVYRSTISFSRRVVIYCSKINTPVGEATYLPEEKNNQYKLSTLNNTQVKIGHVTTEFYFEGQSTPIPTERYVAEFTVAGIHTQVATDNLTLDEFLTVVKSIIRDGN